MRWARDLNRMNGTSVFTAWNVDELPDADLALIDMWLEVEAMVKAEPGK